MLQKFASIVLLGCVVFSNSCTTDDGSLPDACGQLDARKSLLIEAAAKYKADPNNGANCKKYREILDIYLYASVNCPSANLTEQTDAHNTLNALQCP